MDAGLRACLAEEFSSVWVVNLRGNARTSGEEFRAEGGKVFGQGSRASVAITILVRNPAADHEGCRIRYRDIGDYLSREQKLEILREARSIKDIGGWRDIQPDRHNDWLDQRDPAFRRLLAVGTREVKAGKRNDAVFRLFSNGYKTSRDAWTYSFSREACARHGLGMVQDYMSAVELRDREPGLTVADAASQHSTRLRWDHNLEVNLKRGLQIDYTEGRVRRVAYRPFVKQHGYVDYILANSKYQQDRIFPLLGDGTSLATADRRPAGR